MLWRAHLASPPFFRQVDWAPAMQTESARLLLNSNAGSPTEYPCVAYSMHLDAEPRSDFMGQLFRWPKDGHHHHYCFSFAGLGWLYIVSQHAGRHALAKHALRADGTFHVRGFEIRGSSLERQLLDDVFLPNVANVERIRSARRRSQDSRAVL